MTEEDKSKGRIRGNYAAQPDGRFPVDAETLEYIERNIDIAMLVGNLALDSDKDSAIKGAILWGCEIEGVRRKPGYVFMCTEKYPEGEILYFPGGAHALDLVISEGNISVGSAGAYNKAYTYRTLKVTSAMGDYTWRNFADYRLPALKRQLAELEEKVAKMSPCPVGTVQIFAGTKIPDGWLLCDGRWCFVADYGALYEAIGHTYDESAYADGTVTKNEHPDELFRIPDLRGRFIVGQSVATDVPETAADPHYVTLGATGGAKEVTLTAEQSGLPAHNHKLNITTYQYGGSDGENRIARGHTNPRTETLTTESTGGTSAAKSHENRPPYYVLSYIIKAK